VTGRVLPYYGWQSMTAKARCHSPPNLAVVRKRL